MGSLRVGHDWVTSLSLFTFMHWRRKWQPTPVFLPGESQRWQSLVGCQLWGRTESEQLKRLSSWSSSIPQNHLAHPICFIFTRFTPLFSTASATFLAREWNNYGRKVRMCISDVPLQLMKSSIEMYVLSRFSHVWLCKPVDCGPPGFSVHEIL